MSDRIEIKAALAVDEAGHITGTAWPFGSPDTVGDIIEPVAFASATPPIPMLAFHDPAAPVGAWSTVHVTPKGLEVAGRLLVDDVTAAREMRALVAAGAVSGLSIGFRTLKAQNRKGGGRTIKSLDLLEISLVTIPAHPGARVSSVKSAARAISLAAQIHRAASALRR